MSDQEETIPQDEVEPARRVVPKFTSFKPAAITAVALSASSDSKSDKDRSREEASHRSLRRHRRSGSRSLERSHRREKGKGSDARKYDQKRHKSGHHDRSHGRLHRPRHFEREQDGISRRRSTKSLSPKLGSLIPRSLDVPRSPYPESRDAVKKAYFIDTKGDENNIVYGTIHRYSVPHYRRRGNGRIVGLPSNIRIDREKEDGKVLVLRSNDTGMEGPSVKTMRQTFAKLESQGVKSLRIKRDETGLEEAISRGLDFVPLSARTRKRKCREEELSDVSQDEWVDRNVEDRRKSSHAPDDTDLEYAEDHQSEGEFVAVNEWGDRKRMVEFTHKVDAEPNNVDAWLAYVNHHDTIINGTGRRRTAAEKRSTAEIKLDILSKALDKNSGNERLLCKYVDVAEEIWDSHKLLLKWKRILQENPASIGLWTKYLNFRQTDFLSFTYPECLKCFEDCLDVLRNAAFKIEAASPRREKLEHVILYIFVRIVVLMRDSGFREISVAGLQAMIELNLFLPSHIVFPASHQEHDTVLDSFEIFWDSEVPRIGESNALGWASFAVAGEVGDAPEPAQDGLNPPPLDSDDPFGSWTDAEVEWLRFARMPARTIDDVVEDDPFRVVLFSDIRAFLFCFSSNAVRRKLIEALLVLMGLPLLYPYGSNSNEMSDVFMAPNPLNPWLWPKAKSQLDSRALTWEGMEPEKKSGIGSDPFEYKSQNFPLGHENIFNRAPGWLGRIENMRMEHSEDVGFVRNSLKSLVEKLGDESLALYHLSWEWANVSASIKKVAKSLLKRFKTSLRLWSAYAQIEWHEAGHESGRRIFSMALAMSGEGQDTIILWHAWMWSELLGGNRQNTLRLAMSIERGKPPEELVETNEFSKASLLKIRRYLEDQEQTMLSIHLDEHAGIFNDVRALFDYLSGCRDLDATLANYDEFLTALQRRGMSGSAAPAHELCLLRKARVAYYHSITARPFKPSTLRSILDSALHTFPHNTAFLGLYAWNESRTRIENRVRTLLRDRVLIDGGETVSGFLFAVWSEMRMGEYYNVHAVRNLFEQAVTCHKTYSSVQLWMTYVEFEIRQKEFRRAKEIVSRGVRHCPWSKDFIMLAFTKLRSTFEFGELRQLLSIMSSEKELRVHDVTELEDMLEGMSNELRTQDGLIGAPPSLIVLPDDSSMEDD